MLLLGINKIVETIESRDRLKLSKYQVCFSSTDIKIRRRNNRKYLKQFLKHFLSTDSVIVSKTLNTDSTVITFKTQEGKEMSLWIDGQNKITSITPY